MNHESGRKKRKEEKEGKKGRRKKEEESGRMYTPCISNGAVTGVHLCFLLPSLLLNEGGASFYNTTLFTLPHNTL